MGVAEAVPGLSGSTVALISGAYERMVTGLGRLTPGLLMTAAKQGPAKAWAQLDGTFLVTLLGGMTVAMVVAVHAVAGLMAMAPIPVASFLAGLVIAACWRIYRRLSRIGVDIVIVTLAGAVLGAAISAVTPINLSDSPLHLFAAGVLVAVGWVLPGISAAGVLLVVGLYASVTSGFAAWEPVTMLTFGAGCLAGLASASHLVANMIRLHRDEAMGVLGGFMLGALFRLWPWQRTVSYQLFGDGARIPVIKDPVLPHVYTSLTGQPAQVAVALVALVAGFGLFVLVDRLSSESAPDSVQ